MSEADNLGIIRKIILMMLEAPIFHSEGGIQTLTGYELTEYRTLYGLLDRFANLRDFSEDQMWMINQAANTLLNIPLASYELYEDTFGKPWQAPLDGILKKTKAILRGSGP